MKSTGEDIAVVGISALFPDARNYYEFWHNICSDKNCMQKIPPSHWDSQEHFDPDPSATDKTYSNLGGFLPDVTVDIGEYGFPPTLVELIDTSQLMAVQLTKEALIDASLIGKNAKPFNRERTGVIVGYNATSNLTQHLWSRLQAPKLKHLLVNSGLLNDEADKIVKKFLETYLEWQEGSYSGYLANIISGRISNRWDLRGVNFIVGAACASSLAAIRIAIHELNSHSCDIVLSGGVGADNTLPAYVAFSKTMTLAKKSFCAPFDKEAEGILLGEGIGFVVLKRLEEAIAEKDRIYGVIKATGAASDGKAKSIYAPDQKGQILAIKNAYKSAQIDPSSISLIEAHGTGTKSGDETELQSLKAVFRDTLGNEGIALGSVKSQIGHTRTAAGIASLIKVLLSLYYKTLPRTSNVTNPHPELSSDQPLYLNTNNRPWFKRESCPRRAAINSFGFGGINYHIVVEEFASDDSEKCWDLNSTPALLAFSEDTVARLRQRCQKMLENLTSPNGIEFYQTLCETFKEKVTKPVRLSIVALSFSHAQKCLKEAVHHMQEGKKNLNGPHTYLTTDSPNCPDKVALLFPGQGSQFINMGKDILLRYPRLQDIIKKMDKACDSKAVSHCSSVLFPKPTFSKSELQQQENQLQQTEHALPCLAVIHNIYTELIKKAEIKIDVTTGQGIGELSALHFAKVLDSDSFFELSIEGGRVLEPAYTFNKVLHHTRFTKPTIPVFANESGCRYPTAVARMKKLLASQITAPVQLCHGIESMVKDGVTLFIESGPGNLFTKLCQEILDDIGRKDVVCMSLNERKENDFLDLLRALAKLWYQGVAVNPSHFRGNSFHPTMIPNNDAKLAISVNGGFYFSEATQEGFNRAMKMEDIVKRNTQVVNEKGEKFDDENHDNISISALLAKSQKSFLDHQNCLSNLSQEMSQKGQSNEINDLIVLQKESIAVQEKFLDFYLNRSENLPIELPLRHEQGNSQHGHESKNKASNHPTQNTTKNSIVSESKPSNGEIADFIIKKVSEIMGYPKDMLELDLNMESDLGIDSIKRAEILSAIQEEFPSITERDISTTIIEGQTLDDLIRLVESTSTESPKRLGPTTTPKTTLSPADFVIEKVSKIMGYPKDMVDLDLNMESELGIDPIKRAKIISAVQKRYPNISNDDPSNCFLGIQTLGDLVNRIDGTQAPIPIEEKFPNQSIESCEYAVVRLEECLSSKTVSHNFTVQGAKQSWVIFDFGTPLSAALSSELKSKNQRVILMNPKDNIKLALKDAIPNLERNSHYIVCLPSVKEKSSMTLNLELSEISVVKSIFRLASSLKRDLGFAEEGHGRSFSIVGNNISNSLVLNGLVGLVKVLSREWESIQCKFISIDQPDVSMAAAQAVFELNISDTLTDVYYKSSKRFTKRVILSPDCKLKTCHIHSKDVFLVTGGGRGITSKCCLKLGEKTGCSFLLLGRTCLDLGEFESFQFITNKDELHDHIHKKLSKSKKRVTPIEVQSVLYRIQSVKDIRETISQLQKFGCRVQYYQCDITQEQNLIEVIREYNNQWGSINGIIHGAGNLSDKLIDQKSNGDLAKVFDPKVIGLYHIINQKLLSDHTKFLILFSSISSILGNKGQSDYALANETLNCVAESTSDFLPNCKAVSICWGAWNTGMVNETLKKRFKERGITPLDAKEGVEMFWKILQFDESRIIIDRKSNMVTRFNEYNRQNF